MSIYARKNSADGADSAVTASTVSTVGDPHLLDQELVVPDYDDDVETAKSPAAPADPAACIAEFKVKREKRERWALAVILNAFLIANMGSMLLVVVANENPDADTNPFKAVVNGTLQWTEDGHQWHAHLYALARLAQAPVFSTPLPLDEIAAGFQWSGIAAGQIPGPQSIGVWTLFALSELPNLLAISGSYGWQSVALVALMWVRFLVVGRLDFAKEPIKGRNILLRKPTAYEHSLMMLMCWMQYYIIFDLVCIKGGQWGGKTAGRAGAMLMVFLEYAWLLLWWFKWGRDGLFMPDGLDETGKADRFATAWLWALLSFSVHHLLHYIFLLPDLPDNTELVTLTGEVRTGEMWLSYLTSQPSQPLVLLTFICFRKQIFSSLTALLRRKQRLQDGAFIAALLADEADVGDLISEATELFRGVPFSKITADLLRSSKGTPADYALSQPCKLNSVDFFVSHSWSDDADQKYARLSVAAADFQRKHGREPIIWLDKLCIDQDNINRALRCLPVFVFSCNRLMILAGNTYCDRLWCIWELYTFFSTSGTRALKRVELYDFSDVSTSPLLEFDVANAHCFSPVDETKLRSIIESGGASNFNDMIREVGLELQSMTGSNGTQ